MKLILLFLAVIALAAPCFAAPTAVGPAKPVARNYYAKKWKKWVPRYWKPQPTPYFRPVWRDVDAELAGEPDNVVKTSEHYFKPIEPVARNYKWKKWVPRYWKPRPTPYYRPVWREVDADLN